MSPVQPRKARDARSLALAIGGLVFGIALLLLVFVYGVPKLTETGTIEVNAPRSGGGLDLGNARLKAELIAQDGPILLPDPTPGGERDIYVQHFGDDPLKGWLAFDAHKPDKGRECPLVWNQEQRQFVDRCDQSIVPADGAGLPSYPVNVSAEEQLSVVLVAPATTPPATALITGSRQG